MGKLFLGLVAASVSFGIQAQGAEKGTADAKAAKHTHSHSTKAHTCTKCKKADKNCVCDEKGGHDDHDHDHNEKEKETK